METRQTLDFEMIHFFKMSIVALHIVYETQTYYNHTRHTRDASIDFADMELLRKVQDDFVEKPLTTLKRLIHFAEDEILMRLIKMEIQGK